MAFIPSRVEGRCSWLCIHGEAFGSRHHTTVMHACDEIEQLRLNDQAIARDIGFLTQVIRD